jgi:hypothetical protein
MPLHLWVGEPPAPRNRFTCAIRIIMVIPQLVVLLVINLVLVPVVIAGWFVALFTGRLSGGMRDFIAGVLRWNTRVQGYVFLLTDVYPPYSLEEEDTYPIRLAIPPQVELNRMAVLFRLFIAIPAWIVASVLGGGLGIVSIGSWFMVLVSGRLPGPLFEATRTVMRYQARLYGYVLMLTPEYPWGAMGDTASLSTGQDADAWLIRLSDGGRAAMIVIIVIGIVLDLINSSSRHY